MEKDLKQFQDDGNFGLVQILLQRVAQSSVCKLGEVYITLTFNEIQEKSGLDKQVDIEKYLQKMIFTKQLRAKINRETKTVQFTSDDNLLEFVESIEAKNTRIVELMTFIREKEASLRSDPKLLRAEAKNSNMSGLGMEVDEQSAELFQ